MTYVSPKTETGITYYRQIADVLAQRISNGDYPCGGRLPSDRQLSQEFGHNRHTIRRALDLLAQRQLIVRRQGKGTFVADNQPALVSKQRIPIVWDRMSVNGEAETHIKLIHAMIEAAATHAEPLQIGASDPVYTLHRLHYLDHEPLILEYVYFPANRYPDFDIYDLSASLRLLQQQARFQIARAETVYETRAAERDVADLLQIPLHAPLMLEKRIEYDSHQQPGLYAEQLYGGDRFSLILNPSNVNS